MEDYVNIKITSILDEIKKNELFFQNPLQNVQYIGYLIEYKLMENYKKKISFEELKNLSQDIQFSRLKEKINFNKINNYIVSTKFESINDLVNELKNGKKYYIILDSLWKKICKDENKNEKGFIFYFKDNKLYLEFNKDKVISFDINNGIIEESSMIQTIVNRSNKRPKSSRNKQNQNLNLYLTQNKKYSLKSSIGINEKKNEYSCLNCKSDIVLKSLYYDKEKNEEMIIFDCTGICGTQITSVKNFNEKFFNNTYFNEKCILCGKIQINEYLKNNNFIYCIYCKKIYCDDCKKRVNNDYCAHNKYIYIYEIRKKCLIHGEKIYAYCYDDKMLLCKECLNNSSPNGHSNHNKVNMEQSILSQEEYILFGEILKYIKNPNIGEENENEELNINIQKQLKEIEEKEKSSYNAPILKKEKKEIELKEKFNTELGSITNDIIKELSSSIHNLEKEKIDIKALTNFFNNLQKIKNDYYEKMTIIEKEHNSEIRNNENICKSEIDSLKASYDEMRKKLKDSVDNENKNSLIFGNNSEIGKLATLFLTSYNFNKPNYYFAKNIYNLVSILYRNRGIYNNAIKKNINESKNKNEILSLIEKKKFITFDNFISNTIRKDFYKPTMMGLKNIKSPPSMNSILQCFTQIEKFVSYFKYDKYYKDTQGKNNQIKLSNSFKYLIENLWPTNDNYTNNQNFHKNDTENYFSPYEIRDSLFNNDNSLDLNNRISPKDLIIFIILTLHKELNKTRNNVNDNIIQQIDDTNRALTMNNYMNNFRRENLSVISDDFYFMKEIIIKCTNCQISRFKFQTIFYLDFQLNEVLKLKNFLFKNFANRQNINNAQNRSNNEAGNIVENNENINEINVVNIYDCFAYEKIRKFKLMYCNNCKGSYQFCYYSKMSFTPKIMIIFINKLERFNSNMKFEFYEDLNVQQFVDFPGLGFNYKLIGVVVSSNNSDIDKHFIAFCRSPIDKKWYKYDDMKVELVSNIKEEILKSNPSILIYENANNNKN